MPKKPTEMHKDGEVMQLDDFSKKKRIACSSHLVLVVGLSFIVLGIGTLMYPPYNLLLDLRIRMTPGLPPYDWFMDPPDEVLMRVYVFNITNADEFMNGTDARLKVQEIGPIVYREKLVHTNPIFNQNGTFTYTANRSTIFLPEMNTIDINSKIVMPNLGVLMIATYFFDASFFTKLGVNLMIRSSNSQPFIRTTINKYLWNETDPIMKTAQNLAPRLVPTKNVGVLSTVYQNFVDNVTVRIGPTFGHRDFFNIDKFNGLDNISFRGDTCRNVIVNSSEGVCYSQMLTRNDTLKYWRKTLCKTVELIYTKDVYMYKIKAYKYELSPKSFDRTYPAKDDCNRGYPELPSGLSDVSPCAYDTSIATSFPHFLYGDDILKSYVEGLNPDHEKHDSYVIVEPNTGIPLHGVARSQVNLVVKDMRGFNEKLHRFSNLTIPLCWIEYDQVGLPYYISMLLYATVVLVPIVQKIFTVAVFATGLLLLLFYTNARRAKRSSNLMENKSMAFEVEAFLKKQRS